MVNTKSSHAYSEALPFSADLNPFSIQQNPFDVQDGEEVFYKSDDDRTSPDRHGDTYDSIEDEFYSLQRLHRIAPEIVAQPICMNYDEDGEPVGYFMQKAEGRELNDYTATLDSSQNLDPDQIDTDVVKNQISYFDALMDVYGESHGDLHPKNIMIDETTSSITVIDPVGYDRGTASTEEARQKDREKIDSWLDDLEAAS
jgi:aminoglycoside phosphotransferase (APT) family kinase protein